MSAADFQPAEATIIKPGDRLLLRYAVPLNLIEVESIKKRAREMLPDVDVFVVSGVADMVVYRPDPA